MVHTKTFLIITEKTNSVFVFQPTN